MPLESSASIAIVVLAAVYAFANGFNDSGNVVATIISTGALSPRRALLLAATCEFIGPFLFGTAIAATIGRGILRPTAVDANVIIAALLASLVWALIGAIAGLPSSATHALIGGLVGAGIAAHGPASIIRGSLVPILGGLVIAPLVGFFVGVVGIRLTYLLTRRATPGINLVFRRSQIVSSAGLGLLHGTSDAQKAMGIMALGLAINGDALVIPLWVTFLSAACLASGIYLGGWRVIRTLGVKIYRVRPVHGFVSQSASGAVLLAAVGVGAPVSTSQVVATSIMGVGAGERVSKVRWGVAFGIVVAWLVTLPVTVVVGGVLAAIFANLT